ncbi:Dolichol kinase, partial [Pseudolycoriella hygida]
PNSSNGLWLSTLLPLAYITNTWKHKSFVQFQGNVSTIVVFGLFLQTLAVFSEKRTNKSKRSKSKILLSLPAAFTSFLIWICLNQGIIFSISCGTSTLLLYGWFYVYILEKLPHCFTFGEASIVAQGFVIFLLNAVLRLIEFTTYNAEHDIDEISLILQVGLIGVTIIVTVTHFVNFFKKGLWFFVLVAVVLLSVILFPVRGYPCVILLYLFVFADNQRLVSLCGSLLLICVTVGAIVWFHKMKRQSNTRIRKLFHVLTVTIFLPGIIYQCQLLFVATVLLLAVFIVLEAARLINLGFVGSALDETIKLFVDEKDAGSVALTPIYLLVGCSLPLWLHPCPWCLTENNNVDVLPLISGVLSVGVGDTVASVIGSKYGNFMWLNGAKSVEGTLASILVQGLVLISLVYSRCLYLVSLCGSLLLICVTVGAIVWFHKMKRQSNTRIRKLFHVLTVTIFLPGIIYQCQLLFVATVLLLAVFIVLEAARLINLGFVGSALDETIKLFVDEKDAGSVALTPIYLLVGCSLPLWLHPCPWCLTENNNVDVLPLISGVLSVGVGDTVASVIGSKYGNFMWLNGAKSVEGTLASILVQGLVLISLVYSPLRIMVFLPIRTIPIPRSDDRIVCICLEPTLSAPTMKHFGYSSNSC